MKSNRSQNRPIAIIVLAITTLMIFVFGLSLADGNVEFMLFGMALSALYISLLPAMMRRNYFIYEPASFVAFSVIVGLVLKTFYVVLGYHTNVVVYGGLMKDLTIPELQFGASVLLMGLTACMVGYMVRLPVHKTTFLARYAYSERAVLYLSVAFISVSILAFVYFLILIGFSFNGLESLSQKRFQGDGFTSASRLQQPSYYMYRLSLISKAPMYVLFYLILRDDRRILSPYGILFIAAFLINMLVPFMVSNKAGLVVVIADLFVIAFGLRRRFPYLKFFIATAAILACLSIIADIRGGDSVADYSYLDRIFGGRYFVGLTKTAHIVNAFPDYIDYFYGTTLVGWLNIVLPQSMDFSADSFTNLGYFLGSNVFGFRSNGIPPGIIAEFYLNFGVIGVIVGMFIVGLFLYRIHYSLFPHLDRGCVLIVYALLVVRVPTFLFNNGVSVALLKTIADLLFVLIFLFMAGKFGSNKARRR